ncbi:hypothetical protein pb186bvf_003268 [Paramecium bursaria]
MQITKTYSKAKYLGAFFGTIDSGKDQIIEELCDRIIQPQTRFYSIHKVSIPFNKYQTREHTIINCTHLERNRDESYLNDFADSLDSNIFDHLFCFVKFDRVPIMREQLRFLILPLINYLEEIVIVVTHFDLSQEQSADKQLLNKHIQEYFRVKSIIVTKMSDSKQQLKDKFNDVFNICKGCVKISKQQLKFTQDLKDNEYQKQLSLLNQMTQEATKTLNNQVRGNRFTQENQKQLIKSYSQTPQLTKYINKDMTNITSSRFPRISKLT